MSCERIEPFNQEERRWRVDELLMISKEELGIDPMPRPEGRLPHLHVEGGVRSRGQINRGVAQNVQRRRVGLLPIRNEQQNCNYKSHACQAQQAQLLQVVCLRDLRAH